jgi:hypothetical protein
LPYILSTGIDAVWKHDGFIDTKSHYTVTEAKASESKYMLLGLGKKRAEAKILKTDRLIILNAMLGRPNGGATMTQMSKSWVKDRAKHEDIDVDAKKKLETDSATRRVVLVTLEFSGAADHVLPLADDTHRHEEHGITDTWDANDIDAVIDARVKAEVQAKSASKPGKSNKPQKPR